MEQIRRSFVFSGMMTTTHLNRRSLLLTSTALLTPVLRAGAETAGRAWLDKFLAAFNSSSPGERRAFVQKYVPSIAERLPQLEGTREMTGGFELVRIGKDEPGLIEAVVKEKLGDNFAALNLTYEGDLISKARIQRIPRPSDIAPPERLSWEQLVRAVDEKAKSEAQADRFAGAILIARNGKVLYKNALGLADRDRKIANALDTRFRIGSMNKMFTAAAALQLVSKGKLDLAGNVGKYLPDYPNRDLATKVTIRHLLTHTGGTGDIFGPEFDKHRLELKTLADYVKLYGARGLEFEPGSKWNYSNYGFLLLGSLIEAVSGLSYYEYVRKNIFEPAGMTASASEPEDVEVARRSKGYMRRDGTWVSNTSTLPYRGTSAGGGYSTVEDLAAFAAALQSGKILDLALVKQASSKQADAPMGPNGGYGFGMIIDSGENPNFGHGGGAPGMNGELKIYPKSGAVVSVLANLDPPAASRLAAFLDARMPLA